MKIINMGDLKTDAGLREFVTRDPEGDGRYKEFELFNSYAMSISTINSENPEEFMLLDQVSKEALLKMRDNGLLLSAMRNPKAGVEAKEWQHMVFTLSEAETQAFVAAGFNLDDLKLDMMNALNVCNGGSPALHSTIGMGHDNTSNFHVHVMRHVHGIDHATKTITNANPLYRDNMLKAIEPIMKKYGLNGEFIQGKQGESAAQAIARETSRDTAFIAKGAVDTRNNPDAMESIKKIDPQEALLLKAAETLQKSIDEQMNQLITVQNALSAIAREKESQQKIEALTQELASTKGELATEKDKVEKLSEQVLTDAQTIKEVSAERDDLFDKLTQERTVTTSLKEELGEAKNEAALEYERAEQLEDKLAKTETALDELKPFKDRAEFAEAALARVESEHLATKEELKELKDSLFTVQKQMQEMMQQMMQQMKAVELERQENQVLIKALTQKAEDKPLATPAPMPAPALSVEREQIKAQTIKNLEDIKEFEQRYASVMEYQKDIAKLYRGQEIKGADYQVSQLSENTRVTYIANTDQNLMNAEVSLNNNQATGVMSASSFEFIIKNKLDEKLGLRLEAVDIEGDMAIVNLVTRANTSVGGVNFDALSLQTTNLVNAANVWFSDVDHTNFIVNQASSLSALGILGAINQEQASIYLQQALDGQVPGNLFNIETQQLANQSSYIASQVDKETHWDVASFGNALAQDATQSVANLDVNKTTMQGENIVLGLDNGASFDAPFLINDHKINVEFANNLENQFTYNLSSIDANNQPVMIGTATIDVQKGELVSYNSTTMTPEFDSKVKGYLSSRAYDLANERAEGNINQAGVSVVDRVKVELSDKDNSAIAGAELKSFKSEKVDLADVSINDIEVKKRDDEEPPFGGGGR